MPQLNALAITTLAVSASASLVAWQALKRIQYVGPDEQVSTAHHGGNSLPQTAHHGEQLASARTAMHHLTIGVLQVLLKRLTDKVVVNGPTVFFPSPLTTLSYKKRKGISLTALQCGCPLPSSMGARRACSEIGPGILGDVKSHTLWESCRPLSHVIHSFLYSQKSHTVQYSLR